MEVVTYSLRDGEGKSDQYYRDIAVFTDEVLAGSQELQELVQAFRSYLLETKSESPRSQEEYGFELLMLGTLWRCYSRHSLGLPNVPRKVLTELAYLRNRSGCLKPGVDFLRGILATLYLSGSHNEVAVAALDPTLNHLGSLLKWLDATGEFRQEVKRLQDWQDFLATRSSREISDYLSAAIEFASWFEVRSVEALGRYTADVELFLSDVGQNHRWKEDIIFCSRRRVEYHLSMVGAEIISRADRDAFLHTTRKEILVPKCMRSKPEGQCKAQKTKDGARCAGCAPGCKVNQLTRMGMKLGFGVLVISHESSAFAKRRENEDVGIVGVACINNLISGGFKAKDLGIPAQCILLDYCGCKNHWQKEGITTGINIDRLMQVLGTGKSGNRCL